MNYKKLKKKDKDVARMWMYAETTLQKKQKNGGLLFLAK